MEAQKILIEEQKIKKEEKPLKIKYPKEKIAEGAAIGGLKNEDVRQHYKINYMPPVREYEPKLEIAIIVIKEKEGKQVESYRSIRFTNSAQILTFLLNVTKGYWHWMRKMEQVRPDNFDYKLQKFLEAMDGVVRHPENYQ